MAIQRTRPTPRSLTHLARVLSVSVLAAAALAVAPGTAAAAPVDPGPVAEWSTTTGTDGRVYIADANGRALQFHGFNIKTGAPAADASDELLAMAAERGMDHLRLGWFWQDLEPEKDRFDQEFLDQLVTVLDRAEQHGIRVILDMHQDVYGEAFNSRGIPAWATRTDGLAFEAQESWLLDYLQPAVQAAFDHLYEDADLRQQQIDAWMHVVERVKDHPALFGYDLLNEPFGQIRDGEDLFTAAARVERDQLTPMYQRLTDAISTIDADHWIFIEPPNLASLGIATSLGEVHGPKVAVYPHMYDADIESATYAPDGKIQFNPDFFAQWANAITTYTDKYPMPLLVGEWGIAHPEIAGMDDFVAASLDTLDEVSSGWSMFQMCTGGGYCPIDEAGNDRPAIGQIFQPYARAIAGAPTSTRWDREGRILQLRFRDSNAQGSTDIFLGADRTFPGGWTVETSDPAGSWSQSYDEATGVLSVTTNRSGGDHAICVKPTGAPAGCEATDPEPPPTTTPGSDPDTEPPDGSRPATAPPARPISGRSNYTG